MAYRVKASWLAPALAIALSCLLLWIGRRSFVSHSVSVSFSVEASEVCPCLLLYTESPDEFYSFDRSVNVGIRPGVTAIDVQLPVKRLERLRIDVRNNSTGIRAGRIKLSGAEERILDWNDFRHRKNVSRFAVGADGSVEIVPNGKGFYVGHVPGIGIGSRSRPNVFAVFCLLSAAVAFCWILSSLAGILRLPSLDSRTVARTAAFFAAAAILVVSRMALTAGLPPWFFGSSWDDLLFAKTGVSIANGYWLGSYDHHILSKGCFGPMIVAASMLAGVPFLVAETLLYVAGCVFFVWVLSRSVRSRMFLLAALAFLLFNPVSYSSGAWQRIYRNGMPLWQVPLVVGCLFLMYQSCCKKLRSLAKWAVFSGLALWAFQNTREDGIWIWPFALVCMALSAMRAAAAGDTRPRKAIRVCVCFLPVAVFMLGNAVLCLVNWGQYGLPIRNDRDSGSYAKAMRDLYLIEPDPDDDARLSSPEHDDHHHGIYYSTLCKAYDASPTLNGARREIDAAVEDWVLRLRQSRPNEKDLSHGLNLPYDLILSAIRNGVYGAGHYASPRDGEAFWCAVHDELSMAFADGRLSRRGMSVTAMAAPFRPKQTRRIVREWGKALIGLATFWKSGAPPSLKWIDPDNPKGQTIARPTSVPVFEAASSSKMVGRKASGPIPQRLFRVANKVATVYVSIVPWAVAAALAAWAVLSVLAALRLRVRSRVAREWLLATGLLGSILVHSACIAYVSATTFPALGYFYMAASCQMVLMFVVVVGAMAFQAAASSPLPAESPDPLQELAPHGLSRENGETGA